MEGERFPLPEAVARQSSFVDRVLSAQELKGIDSDSSRIIECPIPSTILLKVTQYLSRAGELVGLEEPDVAANSNVDDENDEVLASLFLASDFLKVPKLLQATSFQSKS
jgi:hypothetical protein